MKTYIQELYYTLRVVTPRFYDWLSIRLDSVYGRSVLSVIVVVNCLDVTGKVMRV
jgi:hypothetical protein